MTEAEKFFTDTRITEAKNLLMMALKDHQSRLDGIRSPDPSRKQNYDDMIKTYGEIRGSNLWFPYLRSGIGKGPLVELLDGSVKYDFIGGVGIHILGHSHPLILESSIDAALSDTVMQGNLQQNADAFELSKLLAKAAGKDHCFLSSSGVMANENALKMAFQNRYPANRILAFEGCFAGRTWAFSQITDRPTFRQGVPPNVFVDYLPYYDPERPNESIEEAILTLNKYLQRHPKQYAAMVFELVQGERGARAGSTEFFQAIMRVLKEHEICVIIDEVQTFGRTYELFAFQHFGLEEYADFVTIGKLSQVCATLYNTEFNPRPGLIAQTFTSSTAAIRSSKAIVEELLGGGYYGKNGKVHLLHQHFEKNLQNIQAKHPGLVEGPYGIGAMVAFTPLGGDLKTVTHFIHALFDAGVMCFIAGTSPARARFLIPAGAMTTDDIDAVTKIVEETLLKMKQ